MTSTFTHKICKVIGLFPKNPKGDYNSTPPNTRAPRPTRRVEPLGSKLRGQSALPYFLAGRRAQDRPLRPAKRGISSFLFSNGFEGMISVGKLISHHSKGFNHEVYFSCIHLYIHISLSSLSPNFCASSASLIVPFRFSPINLLLRGWSLWNASTLWNKGNRVTLVVR